MFKIIKIGFIVLIANLFGLVSAQADRLKDLTSIAGVRSNQLIGYGLVVGLAGTGDGNAAWTQQSMQSMISQFGVVTSAANMNGKNAAAVIITAELLVIIVLLLIKLKSKGVLLHILKKLLKNNISIYIVILKKLDMVIKKYLS